MELTCISSYVESELRWLFRNQPGNDPPQTRTVVFDTVTAHALRTSPGQHLLTWDNGHWRLDADTPVRDNACVATAGNESVPTERHEGCTHP